MHFIYIKLTLRPISIWSKLKKFTPEEIKRLIDKDEKEIREKVLLLANGMIDVHGYDRHKSLEQAKKIARNWLSNGKRYKR